MTFPSDYQYSHYSLQVFTKSPRLGTVKTRMQCTYPPEFSLALHSRLVEFCLSNWTTIAVCPITLRVAGELDLFKKAFPDYAGLPIYQQHGVDLGERLYSVCHSVLPKQYEGVLLVGTDCPFIDECYIRQACMHLDSVDVVIGPALDGGYVLLGVKQAYTDLFTGIDWGTDKVFQQTIERVEELGLSYYCLPALNDIDLPDDLVLLKNLDHFKSVLNS